MTYSSLNGSWIEVFRVGDYGDRGQWTAQDLDRLVAAYDTRLQPAPIVVGHPKTDSPAYGWVARLRRAGQSLWAQLEKVDQGFESLLRDGRFRQRSVALYRHFAPAGGPYLRHIGFLGAQPPAVKGLAPVRFFASATDASSLVFNESLATPAKLAETLEESVTHNRLEQFFDHLRGFFTEAPLILAPPVSASTTAGRGDEACGDEACGDSSPEAPESQGAIPGSSVSRGGDDRDQNSALPGFVGRGLNPATTDAAIAAASEGFQGKPDGSEGPGAPEEREFTDRLAELEQRINALTASPAPPTPAQTVATATADLSAEALPVRQAGLAKAEVNAFVESLRSAGKFPPAYDRLGVGTFLHHLAAQPVCEFSGSGDEAPGASSGRLGRGGAPSPPAQPAPAFACHPEQGQAQPERVEGSYPSRESSVDQSGQIDQTPFAWFQEFLKQLPRVIQFAELSAPAGDSFSATHPAPIRFAEPRRGVEVDPESVVLAQRAETLAAAEDITYAEALTRLRTEARRVQSSA